MKKTIILAITLLALLASCGTYQPGKFVDEGILWPDGTITEMNGGGGESE